MPRPGMAKCEVTPRILGPAGSRGPLRGGTVCFAKTLELYLEGCLDPGPVPMLREPSRCHGARTAEKGPGGGSPFVLLYFLLLTLCYGGC